MSESPVLYEKSDHVVTITMNRPDKKNAINMAMRERLLEAWAAFRDDDDAWVVILTGTGDAFSSGGDLKENLDKAEGRMREPWPSGRAV